MDTDTQFEAYRQGDELLSDGEALDKIMGCIGYANEEDLLEAYAYDEEVPGICMLCGTYKEGVYRHEDEGYCDNCNSNNVVSFVVLMDAE